MIQHARAADDPDIILRTAMHFAGGIAGRCIAGCPIRAIVMLEFTAMSADENVRAVGGAPHRDHQRPAAVLRGNYAAVPME